MPVKKILIFCLMAATAVSFSFAQIYRGEGEGQNGTVAFSLRFAEYAHYRYLLHIAGVSIFLNDDNLARLEAALEKFGGWETLAKTERISLTRTIDTIAFSSFHYNHTFFEQPLIFYLIFTGGPARPADISARQAGNGDADSETQPLNYSLFIDTNFDGIAPFRLSSKTVQEWLLALSPENLAEAWNVYERQKALEEMFR